MVTLALALLHTPAALAQTTGGTTPQINAQLFRPSIDATKTMWADDTYKSPSGYLMGRFAVHYAKDPAIYTTDSGEVTKLVSDIVASSFLGAYTAGPVRFGVDVPVYWRSIGTTTGGETGIGDIAIDLRGTLVDRTKAALGLAIAGRANLPTSTVSAPLGHPGFSWEVSGIVDREFGDKLLATLNLGTKGVPEAQLENFEWNDQLFVRGGLGYGDMDGAGLSLDVAAHTNYASFGNPYANPSEAMVGGWATLARSMKLRGAIGTGLTAGMGAPQLRVVTVLAYEPPRAPDTDKDGYIDSVDTCPLLPEDFDEVADEDGCPEPTPVTVNIVDQAGTPIPSARWTLGTESGAAGGITEVFGGEYAVTASAPGYRGVDASAVVPDAEAHVLSYTLQLIVGELTVRAVNPAMELIPDASWQARSGERVTRAFANDASVAIPPGEIDVRVQAPGYKPQVVSAQVEDGGTAQLVVQLEPAMAEIVGDRIDIKESVYFETAKAVIKPESFGLLDEVATILLDHPELTKVRIEGHTDSRGSASYNRTLSDKRAASVLEYLIDKGVDGGRLESIGYGEDKPLDTANNAKAWEKNRRVDFFVVERED
ncbi:MAG: OOP family OmpA-OmpF porin [Myxococcota bacterium]|jgi:OOP family OmpA-OmpF porin